MSDGRSVRIVSTWKLEALSLADRVYGSTIGHGLDETEKVSGNGSFRASLPSKLASKWSGSLLTLGRLVSAREEGSGSRTWPKARTKISKTCALLAKIVIETWPGQVLVWPLGWFKRLDGHDEPLARTLVLHASCMRDSHASRRRPVLQVAPPETTNQLVCEELGLTKTKSFTQRHTRTGTHKWR